MTLLHGLGFVSALGYGFLGWLGRLGQPVPLGGYYAVLATAWASLGIALWVLSRNGGKSPAIPILLWALVFRAIGMVSNPVLEDDFYRYLWDGRQLAVHGNPYDTTPKDHFEDAALDSQFEAILSRVNYPHLPTIYAPVLQYLFGAAYFLSPGVVWPLKFLLLIADGITGFLLWRLGGIRGLLIYAWCPLLIQECSFTAHPDLWGAMFMVAAWFSRRNDSPVKTGLFVGLALGTKITGAAIAPFLLKGQPRRAWVAAVSVWIASYLPFWLQGSWADWRGLAVFAREWEFNSGGFALVSALVGPQRAGIVALVIIAIPLLWLWLKTPPKELARGDWIYGWFFLFSAVVQPWYLLWLLPWVAVYPSWAGLTALASVSLSYVTWLHLGADHPDLFGHPGWVRPLEYGLVLVALGLGIWQSDGFKARRNRVAPIPTPPGAGGR